MCDGSQVTSPEKIIAGAVVMNTPTISTSDLVLNPKDPHLYHEGLPF
jgi:hypothetical protein